MNKPIETTEVLHFSADSFGVTGVELIRHLGAAMTVAGRELLREGHDVAAAHALTIAAVACLDLSRALSAFAEERLGRASKSFQ